MSRGHFSVNTSKNVAIHKTRRKLAKITFESQVQASPVPAENDGILNIFTYCTHQRESRAFFDSIARETTACCVNLEHPARYNKEVWKNESSGVGSITIS